MKLPFSMLINDAIVHLLDAGDQHVYLVNEDGTLVGVVSQGDFIRFFQGGHDYQVKLVDICNLNPVSVIEGKYNNNDLIEIFTLYGITSVAVVNEDNLFLREITLLDFFQNAPLGVK